MNASTKTRSALRAALKQEDASISERLREETQAAVAQLLEKVPQTAPATSEPVAEPKAAAAAQADPAAAVEAAPAKVVKAKPVARKAAAVRPAAKSRTAKPATKAKAAAAKAVAAAPAMVEPSSPAKGKAAKKAGDVAARAEATATATATKTAAKPVVAEAGDSKKEKREKVVRDSFSMPASEHRRIKALREQLGKAGRLASKSEVLRAGLHLLGERSEAELVALLDGLAPVTKGKRGKKH